MFKIEDFFLIVGRHGICQKAYLTQLRFLKTKFYQKVRKSK